MNGKQINRPSAATFAAALLAVSVRTSFATTYYAEYQNFGTINASRGDVHISSLTMYDPQLLVAPNGTLYAYETSGGSVPHYFGTLSATTGAFSPLINLNTEFAAHGYNPPALAFDSNGDLLAEGIGPNNTGVFGTYSLTTGTFQLAATGGIGNQYLESDSQGNGFTPGSVMTTSANGKTYYAEYQNFGTINASGAMVQISSLTMYDPQLLVAPNGTLYAYETSGGSVPHYFGTLSATTGAFSPLINLNTEFAAHGYNPPASPSIAMVIFLQKGSARTTQVSSEPTV